MGVEPDQTKLVKAIIMSQLSENQTDQTHGDLIFQSLGMAWRPYFGKI